MGQEKMEAYQRSDIVFFTAAESAGQHWPFTLSQLGCIPDYYNTLLSHVSRCDALSLKNVTVALLVRSR